MPVNVRAAAVYDFTLTPRDPFPLVRGWNRLEGRPRSEDFDRSLRAEVRDPVWFLTRQWQYGELEGDDAGSPIDARIAFQTEELGAYTAGERTLPYEAATPLEVRVEREPVPFDLMLHMQAARIFERLLAQQNLAARLGDYANVFRLDYDSGVAGEPTAAARAHFDAGRAFLFDAAALIAAVRDGSHAARIAGLPGITGAETDLLVAAGHALVAWFERAYSQSATDPQAWRSERLDYPFAVTTQGGTRLNADDYRGGDLDWHAFSAAAATQGSPAGTPAPQPAPGGVSATTLSFLPTAIRFSAMPSSRYWEMEDGRVDFGRIDVNANDLARLLFTEFMLLFCDDWGVLPLELPVGSLTRINGLLVTDVFGDQTLINPADRGGTDWQRWSMFRMSGDATPEMGLLLAPALTATLTSAPLEEVQFLRDEMANMVWAVEHRLASKLGEPLDPEVGVAPTPPPPSAAAARYRLGDIVPENWRPFIPAHVPGSVRAIRLQRARMPGQPAEPRGVILQGPAPSFVAEEEVPRAGRIVRRSFQRARWIDGATFLWIGRESSVGRGEGSSGLAFDQIEEG
jgi:hypothetical protein